MAKVLEKTERRLGEKLSIKGERCLGPKCALARRAYPPGAHGKKVSRGRRNRSEFGTLLREKQKIRYTYGLDDREVERYSSEAASKQGVYAANLITLLETRLDNTVYRLGFVESRRAARQLVTHGHVAVNGKTVSAPSFRVKRGDSITLKERAIAILLAANLELRIKNYTTPQWLLLDKNAKAGTVKQIPQAEDAGLPFDITKIKEYYSR